VAAATNSSRSAARITLRPAPPEIERSFHIAQGKPRGLRPVLAGQIGRLVDRLAPRPGGTAALADRHPKDDVRRTLMRLAVIQRLVETGGKHTLPVAGPAQG
jgi:hypothetical protein